MPHRSLAYRTQSLAGSSSTTMSAWPTVPGIALMVICLTAGGLIRDFATDVYYGKPKPTNLDIFTKALLHRDLQIYKERKTQSS